MSDTRRRHALVVGAGVGGLAAAIALEQAGLRVTVLERTSEVSDLGFALVLAPNAMRALSCLGVADRIRGRANVATSVELRSEGGRILRRIDLAAIRHETGEDTLCALRPVVHGALLAALTSTTLRTGAEVQGFESSADQVRVELVSGEQLEGDFLIGADGIHSRIRGQLHGDGLRDSHLVGIRGVCRSLSWNGGGGAQYLGRGLEAGVARAGEGAVYWFVAGRPDAAQELLPPKAAALLAIQAFDPEFVRLVEQTVEEDVRRDVLEDRAPLAAWGKGRVSLLGDAAHPMLPHAGQGAAQALEDGVVLGRCMARESDILAALQRYEQLRSKRTERVVVLSRRNARMVSLQHPWLCALRNWFVAHGPSSLFEQQLIALARVDLQA